MQGEGAQMLVAMTVKKSIKSNSKIQILLIEDNDSNRLLLRDFLRHCGHDVTALASGAEIFETLARIQVDIILLDLKLPEPDGFQILATLQSHPIFRQIPVVVVSGLAFQSDQQRAKALNARHYLVKPIKLNELESIIQQEVTCG